MSNDEQIAAMARAYCEAKKRVHDMRMLLDLNRHSPQLVSLQAEVNYHRAYVDCAALLIDLTNLCATKEAG